MKGTSYTYFTTENAKSARDLVAILKEAKANVPAALEEMTMFGGGVGGRSESLIDFLVSCLLIFCAGRYGGGGGGGGGGRRGGGGGYGNSDHGYGGRDNGYGSRGGGGNRW